MMFSRMEVEELVGVDVELSKAVGRLIDGFLAESLAVA
jgi:hypothetical protein